MEIGDFRSFLCKITFRLLPFFLLFGSLFSCESLPEKAEKLLKPGIGRITLYLNGPQKSILRLVFDLERIQVRSTKGGWITVLSRSARIDSHAVAGSQLRLVSARLPKGTYDAIKFTISGAAVVKDGQRATLLLSDKEVVVDFYFQVFGDEDTTLFLNWDVDRSLPKEHLFAPSFKLSGEVRELRSLKIYVSNEGSDTVSVINRAVDKVVSVVAVGNRPKGMAVGRGGHFVFVANYGSDSISVIDISTNRVVQTINLEFGDRPADVALDPLGRLLLVANFGTHRICIIDAFSFQIIGRVEVGKGPVAISVYGPGRKAYIAEYLSNEVTVLDIPARRILKTIPVESRPVDLAVDPLSQRVFVANYRSNEISVIDSSADRTIGIVTVGVGASGVVAEPGRDRIFVSKERSGRLLYLRPTLNSITHSILVGESPGRVSLDAEGRKLLVVSRGSDTLTVIDKFTARKEATVRVGAKPYDVVSIK